MILDEQGQRDMWLEIEIMAHASITFTARFFLQNKVDSPYAIINVSTSAFDFTIIQEGGIFTHKAR